MVELELGRAWTSPVGEMCSEHLDISGCNYTRMGRRVFCARGAGIEADFGQELRGMQEMRGRRLCTNGGLRGLFLKLPRVGLEGSPIWRETDVHRFCELGFAWQSRDQSELYASLT